MEGWRDGLLLPFSLRVRKPKKNSLPRNPRQIRFFGPECDPVPSHCHMIFQKKFLLSDEEYIERIRKSDRNFRRMRWVWLMLLSAMFGVLAWFSHSVQKISTNLPEEKSLFSAGMAPGIIFWFSVRHDCSPGGNGAEALGRFAQRFPHGAIAPPLFR